MKLSDLFGGGSITNQASQSVTYVAATGTSTNPSIVTSSDTVVSGIFMGSSTTYWSIYAALYDSSNALRLIAQGQTYSNSSTSMTGSGLLFTGGLRVYLVGLASNVSVTITYYTI